MIDIQQWMNDFCKVLDDYFNERIEFIGLQGSYGRKEATVQSDIDVVVIFDQLTMQDLLDYDKLVSKLPNRELLCGFLAGKDELMNWDKSELFQFYFDTTAIKGDLNRLIPNIKMQDIQESIHREACQIYHICVHNILHEKDKRVLKSLYKSSTFVIQALYYKQHNVYIKSLCELIDRTEHNEKQILEVYLQLKSNDRILDTKFHELSEKLLNWSSQLVKNCEK